MPDEGMILYVEASDPFMRIAQETARQFSLDKAMPTGSVVVKDGVVLGRAANGSAYHTMRECERVKRGILTGQGYELCEGCHPKNHSERRAVADALKYRPSLKDAVLYLWGHWWCCKPCWNTMLRHGITTVYIMAGSGELFNKSRTRPQ